MRVMPFIQCPGCSRILGLEKDDLIARIPNVEYRAICTGDLCKHEFRVPLEMAKNILAEIEEVEPDPRVEEKKTKKALLARQALEENKGNKTQAAKSLGVSVTTLNNHLKYPVPEGPEGDVEATDG